MNEDKDGGDGSFESRLRAARDRQGLDPAPPPKAGTQTSALGVGMRVGVEMVSALAVGAGVGYALDRWLHTAPVLLSLFVLMGGAAGVANVWRVLTPQPPKD